MRAIGVMMKMAFATLRKNMNSTSKKPAILRIKLFFLLSLGLLSISLNAQVPVPNFTATPLSGCSPLFVQFTDQSTGGPTLWNWDLGNGQLSTLKNPTAVYIIPGTYTITLVVRNANGTNSVTKTNYITVNPSPTAAFSANITTGCVPSTIQFTDASIPNAGSLTQWYWDFGDGTTSTTRNPTKTYTANGFYTVSLRVVSSTGCEGTTTNDRYIRIVSGVTPQFTFTPPTTCTAPLPVVFTNQTSGPGNLSYQWDFGNSTTSTQVNPTATYLAPGTYTVRLRAQSDFGCRDSIQKQVTISGTNTSFTAPDTTCLNTNVNFQNTSPTPISTRWDFGNGVQSVKLHDSTKYTAPGTYIVKLVNVYANCTDSITRPIVVQGNPTVDFSSAATSSCRAPFTASFQDISPNAVSWQWDFGDGGTSTQRNPSHQYNAAGQYNVTLTITDSKGCRNTITKPSFIQIVPPTVAISNVPNGGCIPFTFSPIPSVNAIDGVASYAWNFGDGNTSTLPNPTNNYVAVGNYNISLTITTNGGCTQTVTVTNGIRTGTPPTVDFSAAPLTVCGSQAVNFTDLSAPADEWLWDFGDGGTSTLRNPSHVFADTGMFNITLTAFNNRCGTTLTKPLLVRVQPPIASFLQSVNCANKRMVNFNNTSKTDPAYGPITYLWEFGDPGNSTSGALNPSFTYPALGTYTVRLTVTNGACSYTIDKQITLTDEIADFTITDATPCRGQRVAVTAINSNPQNIAKYEWSINGGPFFLGTQSTDLVFPANGVYSISLMITDSNGCTNTRTINNMVTVDGPVANFSVANAGGCRNASITFNDLSSSTYGIRRWTWNFGDGNTQSFTAPPFNHVYADTGRYNVQLIVEDNNDCTDTITLPAAVLITRPRAAFAADPPMSCPGGIITFKDSSAGYGLQYAWDFGDGNTSTLKDPAHTYAGNDTTYTVKLVITDSFGCMDSVIRTNYVSVRRPKPAFTVSDSATICPPLETRFTFAGQDYESFIWDFGDGATSTLMNPTHFYNSFGNFTAKLILTGYGGCQDSASYPVNLYNPFTTTTINYNPLIGCNNLLVDFDITPSPNTRFIFYAGDGSADSSSSRTFQYRYTNFGFYSPYVTLIDSQGCQVSVGGINSIQILGAEPLFGIDKKAFCDTGTVLFANYSISNDPIVSTVWDFGDGTTSTASDPSHRYTQAGTYIVSLTANTLNGCFKTLTDTIRVYATPTASIVSDSAACLDELFNFQGVLNTPDSVVNWTWDLGNGSISRLQNPSTRYTTVGRYNVSLITSNLLGCADTTSISLLVPPRPVITVTVSPTIPVGTSITLPVTYGPGIARYTWTPTGNLSCTDCPNPVASPKFTTKYKVTVEDIYGCTASEQVLVNVICNENNLFVPNTFTPNNDGVNDVFYPRANGAERVQSMRIFNRWGEMIFERKNFSTNDATAGWDGNTRGKRADMDVYVYIIEFVCDNATIIPVKGNVALIR